MLENSEEDFVNAYGKYCCVIRQFFVSHNSFIREQDLEDLIQEVFARGWEFREKIYSNSVIEVYLLGIARNVLKEFYRETRRAAQVIRLTEVGIISSRPGLDPEFILHRWQVSNAIEEAKSQLSAKRKEAFELVYLAGNNIKDATKLAGCPTYVFRRRLHDARKQLQSLLHEWTER